MHAQEIIETKEAAENIQHQLRQEHQTSIESMLDSNAPATSFNLDAHGTTTHLLSLIHHPLPNLSHARVA